MTRHVNAYRDPIPYVAEHVERCIVKAMGGRHCVLIRPNGRIRTAHIGKLKPDDIPCWVSRKIYTAQTPREHIAEDIAKHIAKHGC